MDETNVGENEDIVTSGSKAGLHNLESSKGQIININLPWAAKFYLFQCRDFVVVLKKFFERQLLTGGRAFAKFSTIEKTLATTREAFADRRAARWPYVMQAWYTSTPKSRIVWVST